MIPADGWEWDGTSSKRWYLYISPRPDRHTWPFNCSARTGIAWVSLKLGRFLVTFRLEEASLVVSGGPTHTLPGPFCISRCTMVVGLNECRKWSVHYARLCSCIQARTQLTAAISSVSCRARNLSRDCLRETSGRETGERWSGPIWEHVTTNPVARTHSTSHLSPLNSLGVEKWRGVKGGWKGGWTLGIEPVV